MNVLMPDPDTRADIATPKPAYCYTQDHVLQEKKKSSCLLHADSRGVYLRDKQFLIRKVME